MHDVIEQLKQKRWLWQGHAQQTYADRCTTGFKELDDRLQGGFPKQGVIDIQTASGIGEMRLFLPMLDMQKDERLIVLVAPPMQICADAFASAGLALSRLLIISPEKAQDAMWAAELCLKSGACQSVFLWANQLEVSHARRLEVASQMGQCHQVLFRTYDQGAFSLPVTLAMQLQAHKWGLEAKVTKQKGGWQPQPFIIDMRSRWPHLSEKTAPSNVVPFPFRKQG